MGRAHSQGIWAHLLLWTNCLLVSISTSAEAPLDDVTFFVGSDLHYGYVKDTNDCAAISRGALARMNELPGQSYPSAAGGGKVDAPRGVLLIGDLTEKGDTANWTAFTNDWGLNGDRLLSFPLYEAYGNHDCVGTAVIDGIKTRNRSRSGALHLSANGYHYSWDWDFLHLVCLNMHPGNQASPAKPHLDPRKSLEFLANDLREHVGTTGRLVMLFHHYVFDGASLSFWTAQDRTNYFEIIKDYNVIGIFGGHNHAVDFINWNGLFTWNVGTIGKFKGNFLVVHVNRSRMVVVERKATGVWGYSFNKPMTIFERTSDTDGDGMLNGWENLYRLNPLNAADATQDTDRDGQSNLSEYITATDPRDSLDCFRIDRLRRAGDGSSVSIEISGRAERSYILERLETSLGQWTAIATTAKLTTNQPVILTDTNPPQPHTIYRARAVW